MRGTAVETLLEAVPREGGEQVSWDLLPSSGGLGAKCRDGGNQVDPTR